MKISDIKHIYPIKVVTKANTIKSRIYKIGIMYQNNKSIFINKSLWESMVIKDILKMRFYIFGKYETYDNIKSEIITNEIELAEPN